MTVHATEHDGILRISLDSPRTPVSVLRHADVLELLSLIEAVNPARTRALRFESTNPRSFVNGIERMRVQRAQAGTGSEGAVDAFRALCRALRTVRVPTIAILRGTTFGCGVEFALSFDYRLATDSHETLLYMSQVSGTMGGATFGGTFVLPRLVGFAKAVDILIWGETIRGRKLAEVGLADAVIPEPSVATEEPEFIRRLLAEGTQPAKRVLPPVDENLASILQQTRRQIDALPTVYRPIYSAWLEQLRDGAVAEDYDSHVGGATATAVHLAKTEAVRQGMGFFFIRQAASEVSRTVPTRECVEISLATASSLTGSLPETWRRCVLPGVTWTQPHAADIVFYVDDRQQDDAREVRLYDSIGLDSWRRNASPALLVPLPYRRGMKRLAELSISPECSMARPRVDALTQTLGRLGFEVIVTHETEGFLSIRLFSAFMAPIIRYLVSGGAPKGVDRAFRDFGFICGPGDLVRCLGIEKLATLFAGQAVADEATVRTALYGLASAESVGSTGGDSGVVDATLLSLLMSIGSVGGARLRNHPALVDVVARDVLDFPVCYLSLCHYLRKEAISEMISDLGRDKRAGSAAGFSALAHANNFVTEGREMYR